MKALILLGILILSGCGNMAENQAEANRLEREMQEKDHQHDENCKHEHEHEHHHN